MVYKLHIGCLIVASLAFGCKSFVDIPPPKKVVIDDVIFNNPATANGALMGVYSRMENDPIPTSYIISYLCGISSDELLTTSQTSSDVEIAENNISTNNNQISNLWNAAYRYIYQANVIIEKLTESSSIVPNLKKQILGEALFIRSFWNFYLTNLWGEVPLVLTSSYTLNSKLGKSPIQDIYSQIILDLSSAIPLLNPDYVSSDGQTITAQRVRVNKSAAMALLARVFLYTENYTMAEKYSDSVISNTNLYILETDLKNTFSQTSKEAIWQLQSVELFPTPEAINFVLLSSPSTNTFNSSTLNYRLLNAFDTSESRYKEWVGIIGTNTELLYFPYKYKLVTTNSNEYSTVLRLAEQFLIRAEARARLDKIFDSKMDLDTIRARAGLPPSNVQDQSALIKAILDERQREFFSEWGHRWMDIKRAKIVDSVMQYTSIEKGSTWEKYKSLFPIPQTERNANPNLSQNTGY